MRAAFVVVVGSAPGAIPPRLVAQLDSPYPPVELTFVAAERLFWSNHDRSVVVAVWSEALDRTAGWAWFVDSDGICVISSPLSRCGSRWAPPREWTRLVASSTRPFGVAQLDELTGEFSALTLDSQGHGVAVTDPFAHRGLYLADGRTHSVVASTPALAAAAKDDANGPPALDPLGVCGLAYSKHRIGERTGFVGVRSMSIGSYVELGPSKGITVSPRQPPWAPGGDLEAMNELELIDYAHSVLEEQLVAASRSLERPRLMDLTGGKDSRLLLALALTANVSDEFVFRTRGPRTILDVAIAEELATLADVRWLADDDLPAFWREQLGPRPRAESPPRSEASWSESMRTYVKATAGICNIAHTTGAPAQAVADFGALRPVTLNGLSGEMLRSMVGFALPDETALVRRFDRHFGHLDLLRPDAFRHYRQEWIDDVLTGSGAVATWNDRHDAFLLRTQVRANFGPKLDVPGVRKLMPLSSLHAVRAAYAMGGKDRIAERVHRDIVTRASPVLANHRFAKDGWHTPREAPEWARPVKTRFLRKRARLHDGRLDRPKSKSALEQTPSLNLADHRRMERGYGASVGLLRELLAERSNAAWDVIDPSAVAEATDRYEQLPRAAHVELMGAATAAIWLGRS